MELTKEQYKLLKKINRNKTIKQDLLSQSEKDSCSKLFDLGYVSNYGVGNDGIDYEYYEIQIEESGKMYISTRKRDDRRFLIPLLVSIAALAVSIMALYKSSQPIQINIDNTAINTEHTDTNAIK